MTLLAVDDDDDTRNMIVDALQSDTVVVNTARTGEEAVFIVEKDGSPELLITDIELGPGLNGISLAKYVRARDPNIPILIISGQPWLLDNSLLSKNVAFLYKPFKLRVFLSTLRKLAKCKCAVGGSAVPGQRLLSRISAVSKPATRRGLR
jgi:two-component system cell cycle sensor histidine kinase/response regulator CckA